MDVNQLLEQAASATRRGDFATAQQAYQAILTHDPDESRALHGIGVLALQLNQPAHAAKLLQRAAELVPSDPIVRCNLGTAHMGCQRADLAEAAYRKALALQPGYIDALGNLATVLMQTGRPGEAAGHWESLAKHRPDDAATWLKLAEAQFAAGAQPAGAQAADRAFQASADDAALLRTLVDMLLGYGQVHRAFNVSRRLLELDRSVPSLQLAARAHLDTKRFTEAEMLLREALRAQTSAKLWGWLAESLLAQTRWEEARAILEEAMETYRDDSHLRLAYCNVLERTGDVRAAGKMLRPILEGKGANLNAVQLYLKLAHRLGETDRALRLYQHLLGAGFRLDPRAAKNVHFRAGELFERLGRYEEAFEAYRRGNDSVPGNYSRAKFEHAISDIIATFDAGWFVHAPAADKAKPRMIFIVGMPRSGTSLVEQILASHPDVAAAGEVPALTELEDELRQRLGTDRSYGEALRAVSADDLNAIAEAYRERLPERIGEDRPEPVVTDKMPHNFLRLGLISRLFPDAAIVHCVRDPLDTCVSNYTKNFAGRLLEYSNNQSNLAHHYCQYERLMRHWQRVLPLPIHGIGYEKLVSEPRPTIEAMLAHCGLPWHDAVLDHTRSGVETRTASHEQVKNPIYTSSVQRWRHYEPWIGKLIQGLERYRVKA